MKKPRSLKKRFAEVFGLLLLAALAVAATTPDEVSSVNALAIVFLIAAPALLVAACILVGVVFHILFGP